MKRYFKHAPALLASIATFVLSASAHAQVSVLTQPGTVVGSLSAQNWIDSSPTTLYSVPTGKTARVTDVVIWGGDIAAGHACSVVLYCDTSAGTNLVYFMTEAGKSNLYPFNNGIACGAGGNIVAYYYQNVPNSTAGTTCGNGGNGNNTPWVIVRGYLYTVP